MLFAARKLEMPNYVLSLTTDFPVWKIWQLSLQDSIPSQSLSLKNMSHSPELTLQMIGINPKLVVVCNM